MAEEIGFENGRNSNFEGLVTLTLTLDPAYRRASLIDLYLHTKFHSNRRNFLWTDGRTDIFSPSNIIRSTFGSRPNNNASSCINNGTMTCTTSWKQYFQQQEMFSRNPTKTAVQSVCATFVRLYLVQSAELIL